MQSIMEDKYYGRQVTSLEDLYFSNTRRSLDCIQENLLGFTLFSQIERTFSKEEQKSSKPLIRRFRITKRLIQQPEWEP